MAKLNGPLLSFKARGQIGKGLVTASWRGVHYARQYVVPANPQTTEQTITRSVFSWLNAMYRAFGPVQIQPWELVSVGRPLTARNALIAANLPLLRDAANINDYLFSPGAKGGPAPAAFTAAAGAAAGELDVELVAGALPTGWTVNSASFAIVLDGDPHDVLQNQPLEASVAAPGPYTNTFASGVPGGNFHCGGWFVYNKPDGSLAVSVSPIAQANSHA